MIRYLPLLAAMFLVNTAQAQSFGEVVRFAVGVNGAWYDEEAYPSDFEVGGTARASLQPHLSLVGATFYGVNESYLRGSLGARYTVTDVDNPNFSIGVGAQYNVSSEPAVRPEEWTGDVSLGLRPWLADMAWLILIGQGSFGFDTGKMVAYVGARAEIGGTR